MCVRVCMCVWFTINWHTHAQPPRSLAPLYVQRFATDGLRTLCVAVRPLREEEYERWVRVYNEAATAIQDRAERLDEAAEMVMMHDDVVVHGAAWWCVVVHGAHKYTHPLIHSTQAHSLTLNTPNTSNTHVHAATSFSSFPYPPPSSPHFFASD